jgi:hypothetical protein
MVIKGFFNSFKNKLILKFVKIFVLVLISGNVLVSCATYQVKVDKAREELSRSPEHAAETLKPLALEEGRDQLVYLLDYATALQSAKNYQESTKYFLMADKMAEIKDYHSISKQFSSLALNEEMVQYKGDDYEKVLINAMLSINFLALNDLDGALVETRRLIEKLEHYRIDGKRNYEQNEFAVYLGGLIWESDRKWDDAYISFEKAYELNPDIEYLKEDLIRSAVNARRSDTAKKWEDEFGIKRKPEWFDKSMGEIVLVYQQGWGPRKQPSPQWRRIPTLVPVSSYTQKAELEIIGIEKVRTQKIYDLEKVAIQSLNDQQSSLVAKRIAGIATKEVLSDQVSQKNEALGALMNIAMHVTDRADLRQWSTLPESFQIARSRVPAGEYKIKVRGLNSYDNYTEESSEEINIKVKPGRKSFFVFRTYE